MLRLPWLRPRGREIELVEVILYRDKAFVPIMGRSNLIGWRESEPNSICEQTPESLATALAEIIEKGNPPVRHPSEAEMRQRTPLQRAAGVRSWRELARAGAMAAHIRWVRGEGKVEIAFTPRHTQHNMEVECADAKVWPLDASPLALAECILGEWWDRSR